MNYVAGPGESLFLCPPEFVPCPHLLTIPPEVFKDCNRKNFSFPLPLLLHHDEIYIVDEVNSIQQATKANANSILQLDDWPVAVPGSAQPAFHFVFKYGREVWMEPPLETSKLCCLPKSLFE